MADLLQTATEAGSFTTLLTAIEAAGLVETLTSPGPFTILAPPDEVFAQLPADVLEDILQNESKLKQVLFYHVLFGDVRAEDLAEITEAPTVEGSIVAIGHENGIQINDAKVTQADILTDNGVIHIIDTVLIPTMLIPE